MSEVYLGNPPQRIIDWIINHQQPMSHEETWYKYAGDTEWRTVSIKGSIYGDFHEMHATTQIPNVHNVVEIEIGTDVTSIGAYAFQGCSKLTSITIPEGVTGIEDEVFSDCSALTIVTIPDSVTSIGKNAFHGCNDALFDTTTIPGVKLVDGWVVGASLALSGNLNLTGARGIGDNAFYNCRSLTSVTIPDSVTRIADGTFSWCISLTNVTIPDSVTSIGAFAFSNCSSLTSVKIPNSVTNIGRYAFSGCSGLTSVTIPDGITSINRQVFSGCSGLTSVTIPDSVTSIGYQAFFNCIGLTSVTIGNSVTSIGYEAFDECVCLSELFIESKTVEHVQNMQYYPWKLSSGTIIYCSNGTLIVSSGSSSSSY